MKRARGPSLSFFAVAVAALLAGSPASAVTTYGTLDNFDVVNDTGLDTHGFEIELEGVSPADVAYTFGAPYQRYGDPMIVPTSTGVIIRYAASYGAGTWSATTPVAIAFPPTQGHSCWQGGDPAYPATGCDHFGASLNATPSKTTYRWLVEGPTPGSLTAFGSNVSLPAPVWNVTPPVDPAVNQPIAAVVVAPPVPADPSRCGEGLWAKVFVTELPNGLHAEDLVHLVVDDPVVDIVPDEPIQVEWEWVLLQACPGAPGALEFGGGAEVAAGKEAVSRRFEFYKYTGQYDPDPGGINEARCDNPLEPAQWVPERCGLPDANGVAGVGGLIGAQNAAVNLLGAVVVIPENHPPVANPDSVTTDEDAALMITSATLLGNDTDRDGDAVAVTSVQGAINGTVELTAGGVVVFTPAPNFNGAANFTYTIADGYYTSTATVNVGVGSVNDRPLANAGGSQSVRVNDIATLNGSGSSDVDGNPLAYRWSLTQRPAHSRATLSAATSAAPTFRADKEGAYLVELVVNDGTVDSLPATVTINATKGKKN